LKTEQLSSFVYDRMSESLLPSVSMAVVQAGEILYSRSFGFRDLECGLPASSRTLYCIGSVTKSFTALAVMQLAEAGRLDVQDAVEAYVTFPFRPGGVKVTIEHLLTHSSGIPGLGSSERIIGGLTGAVNHWLSLSKYEDLLTFMDGAEDWALLPPGKRWFYLNEGYIALGAIIEKVSGMTYYAYLRRHILDPLSMQRTFFTREELEKDAEAAVPYVTTAEGKRLPSTYPYSPINSKGGIISCVEDMAKYVCMYLAEGVSSGERLLSAAGIARMQRGVIPGPAHENPFGRQMYGYGLSTLDDFMGFRLVGHGGSVGTATAYMGFIPEKNLGVVVQANGSGYAMSQFGQYALAAALGGDPDALPFVKRETTLSNLAGNYENYRGTMKVQLKRAGDFLVLHMGNRYNQQVIPLIPDSLEGNHYSFHTLSAGTILPVEIVREEDKVTLIYERYAFRKI